MPAQAALERARSSVLCRSRRADIVSLARTRWECQLAKLAQAIVPGPRLLILDEPTNGNPPARRRMID
jgi:energy-coupling factor transporter ATP-binding protein EcfA2